MSSLRPERTFDHALVVAPTGLGRTFEKFGDTERPGWQTHVGDLDDRDLALFDALLVELAPCFDPEQVFSTGFSNGGHFSHLLGCARADKVTAIAPVGGALKERATCNHPVPTLIVHGTADEVVPYSLAEASAARWQTTNGCTPSPGSPAGDHCTRLSCETDLRICAFEGGHTWPRWASAEVGAFFANQPTSPASP
jgi:polyhydroxybutyrate depolymerase